jgi:hypothetical protein
LPARKARPCASAVRFVRSRFGAVLMTSVPPSQSRNQLLLKACIATSRVASKAPRNLSGVLVAFPIKPASPRPARFGGAFSMERREPTRPLAVNQVGLLAKQEMVSLDVSGPTGPATLLGE